MPEGGKSIRLRFLAQRNDRSDRRSEMEVKMWLLFAIGSAFFAGVTSILAKCGIRKTDSTVATAVRTVVVLIFS